MFKAILVLAFATVGVLCAPNPRPIRRIPQLDGRIIGGIPTNITSYPWQVSLQRFGQHTCGGSIYSKTIIVSAAHCVYGHPAQQFNIRAGSTNRFWGGVSIAVAAYKIHEKYNNSIWDYDVAVLRLWEPLTYSSAIRPISLTKKDPRNGAPAVVTGWGVQIYGGNDQPAILQKLNVDVVTRTACRSNKYGFGDDIKPSMICAYNVGKDKCQGDSGGPLVSGGELVGIVSWGFGCAVVNYPGVYADVAFLRSWIVNATRWV